MKTTFDKADRVSKTIGRMLGYPSWYLGVAIEAVPREGYALSVRVERGHTPTLPARIEGVRVRVVHNTMARPLVKPVRAITSR